jgi:hypothetical protein
LVSTGIAAFGGLAIIAVEGGTEGEDGMGERLQLVGLTYGGVAID